MLLQVTYTYEMGGHILKFDSAKLYKTEDPLLVKEAAVKHFKAIFPSTPLIHVRLQEVIPEKL